MEIVAEKKVASLPLISVIIPTYDRAYIIGRTIESALQQSYQNIEVIVVDDASRDNTSAVVQGIGDGRVRYIRHTTNKGGSAARNTGISAAKGFYIAFLDSDDIWLPQKLELQVTAIEKHPSSSRVVSYTQIKNDNGQEISLMPSRGIEASEAVADYLFVHGGEIVTSAVMLPRSLVSGTVFRSESGKHDDLDLYLRLEEKGAIFDFLAEPLTVWNTTPRDDRISRIPDYKFSYGWIQEYTDRISSQAMKGFMIKEVLGDLIGEGDRQLYAEKILVDGLLHKIISPKKFLHLSARVLLTEAFRAKIKRMLR